MHEELYRSGRAGWLRPAVLGANDGIVSTASLVIGVAAAAASRNAVLLAGVAGLVGGATSMAAGEYVSVSSQRDAERADSSRDRNELATDPESELTEVYVRRGLDRELAATVAERLTAVDPSGSHVRDELGLPPGVLARPLQAAVVSALSFAVGAALPLTLIVLAPIGVRVPVTALAALALLALLGAIGARIGRVASQLGQAARLRGAGRAALRVTIGGGLAMGLTALIGQLVGATGLYGPSPGGRTPRMRGCPYGRGIQTDATMGEEYRQTPHRVRRGFTREFKGDAVELVRSTGRPIAAVARELGIYDSTLGNWVRQDRIDRGEAEGLTTEERGRLVELERENARLRMERDLLKRTVAFWVKETSTP